MMIYGLYLYGLGPGDIPLDGDSDPSRKGSQEPSGVAKGGRPPLAAPAEGRHFDDK